MSVPLGISRSAPNTGMVFDSLLPWVIGGGDTEVGRPHFRFECPRSGAPTASSGGAAWPHERTHSPSPTRLHSTVPPSSSGPGHGPFQGDVLSGSGSSRS